MKHLRQLAYNVVQFRLGQWLLTAILPGFAVSMFTSNWWFMVPSIIVASAAQLWIEQKRYIKKVNTNHHERQQTPHRRS